LKPDYIDNLLAIFSISFTASFKPIPESYRYTLRKRLRFCLVCLKEHFSGQIVLNYSNRRSNSLMTPSIQPINKLMRIKSLHLGICILSLMCTVGCSKDPFSSKKNSKDEPSAKPVVVQMAYPHHDDVQGSIAECQTLIAYLRSILHELKQSGSAPQPDELREKISSWRKGEESWKTKTATLLADCHRLLGTGGKAAHPELPLALERLQKAGKWLEKCANALETANLKVAHDCLRRARIVTEHASELLEGRLKEDSDTDE
jgi:hypothetical protein